MPSQRASVGENALPQRRIADSAGEPTSGMLHLEGAHLMYASLGNAHLKDAANWTADNVHGAHGDGYARLPEGVPRPAGWPPEAPER